MLPHAFVIEIAVKQQSGRTPINQLTVTTISIVQRCTPYSERMSPFLLNSFVLFLGFAFNFFFGY
jgi:hypothetical protein